MSKQSIYRPPAKETFDFTKQDNEGAIDHIEEMVERLQNMVISIAGRL